jgi:lipoprotein-anchoring transpeptidase ErfK/SrfK
MSKTKLIFYTAILIAGLTTGCQTVSQNTAQQSPSAQAPTLDATPVEPGEAQWKIAKAETVSLTINAPGARSVRILYRPIVATDRHVVLKTINTPTDIRSGKFSASVKLVADFAGDVWAEVSYSDGTKRETEPIELAAQSSTVAMEGPANTASQPGNENISIGKDESARSDKITGGNIEKAQFQPGQPDIKITVNVPAFHMTVWQNGKEVKTYEIGVGMKKYPIAIGERKITQIIWNPEWVPPDSEWVLESHADVSPGEHIEAGDKRNPLGKLKIPLGDAYLMHQAQKPSDLGHLVSHGCIRMLKDDISDLANKIVAARSLPITSQQIEHAMNSKDRLVANLKTPVPIDVNYDTQVVEGGVLHIYPDVYGRDTNTIDNLREELRSVGLDVSKLDDQTLKQMLDRANANEEFVVSVADIKSGNALAAGTDQPLTSQSIVAKKAPTRHRGHHGARGRR